LGRKNADWIKLNLEAKGPFLTSGAGLGPEKLEIIFYNYLISLINNGGESGIRTRSTSRQARSR
jgi:hypothetical protein